MFSSLAKFLFGTAVLSGVIIGGSLCYMAKILITKNYRLITRPRENATNWADLMITGVLFWQGFASPSMAIPYAIAGVTVSVVLRLTMWWRKSPTVARIKGYFGSLKESVRVA